MENIGCVIYTLINNGLKAEWIISKNDKVSRGTGMGIRLKPINEKKKFEGEYEIIYLEENGKKSPKLKLKILFESDYYKLSWKYNGELTDLGIGIVHQDSLSAGWYKVD